MYTSDADAILAAFFGIYAVAMIISLILAIILLIALWKLFAKAGQPGWAAIIPFYNTYVLFDVAMGNGLLFLLCFIPVVGIVMIYVAYAKLALAYGKGAGFVVGTVLLPYIFLPILAFGNNQYIGPQ